MKNSASIKKVLPVVVAAIVVGVLGFAGGITYAKHKAAAAQPGGAQFQGRGNFQAFGQGQAGAAGGRRGGMGGMNGGFVGGEVLSKDATSITVKLPDGGSKIVFFSPTTKVLKSVEGTAADLNVGAQVTVSGAANADGSVAAQSIQLRPSMLRSTSTQQ